MMYQGKFLVLFFLVASCVHERTCDYLNDSVNFSLTKDEIVAKYDEALVDSPKIEVLMQLSSNCQVSNVPIQIQSYVSSKSKNLYLLINQKGEILLDLTAIDSLEQIELVLKESLKDKSFAEFSILPLWDKQTGHEKVKSVILYLDETIKENYSYDSIDIVFNKPRDIPPPPPME